MRRLYSRILTVALLAAMLPSLTEAVELLPAAVPDSHAAGCHGHGTPSPAPRPVSYQCCAAGHHSVVLTDSFSPRPPQWQVLEVSPATQIGPATNADADFSIAIFSAYSPPGFSPLRI